MITKSVSQPADHRHCLDLIRAAYTKGYDDGRADACVWNAELHADETADRYWQDWWRGMNQDRRDTALHRRIRAQLAADPGKVGWYERLVLHYAGHPQLTFKADPDMRPHGQNRTAA